MRLHKISRRISSGEDPTIHWDQKVNENFGEHFFRRELRSLSDLKPHEKPDSWRVWKIAKAMQSGKLIPMISVAPDGMILDGHGRYYAARRVLKGGENLIPVEVMYLG